MIEQETLGALKLLDSRLGQLVERALLHDRRLLTLRLRVSWLEKQSDSDSDRLVEVAQTLVVLTNRIATLQDALTAKKEEVCGF